MTPLGGFGPRLPQVPSGDEFEMSAGDTVSLGNRDNFHFALTRTAGIDGTEASDALIITDGNDQTVTVYSSNELYAPGVPDADVRDALEAAMQEFPQEV